jgi:hypothetical protein
MHRISTGTLILLLALLAGGAGLAATATPTRAQEAPTATPTIFVVTPTARPEDLFAAATAITRLTVEATTTGTATALPANWRVATATPTPRIVTSTPTAENPATATAMVARETAQALVNGPARPFVTATPTLEPVIVTPTPRVDELFRPGHAGGAAHDRSRDHGHADAAARALAGGHADDDAAGGHRHAHAGE